MAIVPRGEWRTFTEHFDKEVDNRFDALPPESVHESDETYVLSQASDASVKFREGLVDAKVLEAVSADGLEQWRPVLKAGYSLSLDEAGVLMDALGLLAVGVHKRRERYLINGCMAERSQVRIERGAIPSPEGHLHGVMRGATVASTVRLMRLIWPPGDVAPPPAL